MKKFIIVDKRTRPKRINIDKIVGYWNEPGADGKHTILCIESFQDELVVDETVEEIDRMINEATTTDNEE